MDMGNAKKKKSHSISSEKLTKGEDVTAIINCTYGYTAPIGQLNIETHFEEIIALTGQNGSGKSTVLQTIAGELHPLTGEVLIATNSTRRGDQRYMSPSTPDGSGLVNLVSGPEFLPDLTLREHLYLIMQANSIDESSAETLLSPWKITELLDYLPGKLSSGQRQRANIALQLLNDRIILALDEPERHLDKDWIETLGQELVKYSKRSKSVILATHSPYLTDIATRKIQLK